jgi:transposase
MWEPEIVSVEVVMIRERLWTVGTRGGRAAAASESTDRCPSMNTPTDDLTLCTQCIRDARFSQWICDNGEPGACDFNFRHGSANEVVTVERFAEHVDAYFRETYQPAPEEPYISEDSDNVHYAPGGEPYEDILINELDCSADVLRAICDNLPDATHHDLAQGADPFYTDAYGFERISDAEERERKEWEERWYEERFTLQWQEFCQKVQYERRFFNIKEPLDALFGDPKEYENGKIPPMYTLPAGQKLYRARLLDDSFTEELLDARPGRELSAPPRERTRVGRMNVEYIPVFYGAFSEETAVAEIRPGIGEEVAVGEFELRRQLRVFDFTAFSLRMGDRWRDALEHTRYDFIKQMETEISKPIMPYEKQREYIPTQIVAEYLKEYFGCDAVIYRSSMIKDHDKESRNIVILNRGAEFCGTDDAPLSYVRNSVKQILDVTYQIMESPL